MVTDRTGLRAEASTYAARRETPVRTCVGCRRTDSWSVLVRVVVVVDESGFTRLQPDPRHRLPGRGAWLHPDPECLKHAVKRRAFGRALRVQVPTDVAELTAYVRLAHSHLHPMTEPPPQGGLDADEHPMSTQQ